MTAHVRYLRYVLLHKLYVFVAGVAIARTCGMPGVYRLGWLRWLWRLLIHDLSKFSRAEWGPYVRMFYGRPRQFQVQDEIDRIMAAARTTGAAGIDTDAVGKRAEVIVAERQRATKAQFDRAWLHHLHHNPHHWQHWILHEDSGKTIVLLMESWLADEMVADWIGAGSKILARPTLAECVAETVKWYADNRGRMQLREPVRIRVEETLLMLSSKYGLVSAALQVHAAQQARASITIPGR